VHRDRRHSHRRIATLVVDDSSAMLNEMCRYVGALPHLRLVGTAANGQEALEKFESLRPRLILMDFQMPEMNGLQATLKIKSVDEEAKVIIITIHDNQLLRHMVLSQGVDGILSKAQLPDDLSKEVERLFPGR